MEERRGELEGGTEHYCNVAHVHLVDIRLCAKWKTRKGDVKYTRSNGVSIFKWVPGTLDHTVHHNSQCCIIT